jgi:two-component system cell cycle sensor histidine kinase/response regulator CckA
MTKANSEKAKDSPRTLRVLYVEDNPADAELVLLQLKKHGFDLHAEVVDTSEAFQDKLRANPYDIILSDCRLPNWSGMDVIDIVNTQAKNTPVIMVTGTLGDEAAVECIKKGATDYVLKGSPGLLPVAVRRALEDKRQDEERAQGIEDLRASEVRYRRLFESAQDGILMLDAATGEIIDVNPFILNLLGYSREGFLGKRLWEIGPFKDQRNSQESFRVLQENEYIRYDDLPLETRSGKRVDVEFVSNAYWSGERKVIQCNIRDMTERKQAADKLRQSEALFRLISENVTDLIAVVDLDGRRVYNSPSYRGIISNPNALLGTLSFNEVHPDDRENIKAVFHETIRTGVGQRAQYRFLLEDKTSRLIESQGSLIRNQQGEPMSVLIVSRDITERKSLEEQLRQSQKIEAIGQLAGGVAHDFNNLLTIISGYAELVADEVDPEGPLLDHVKEIQQAASRAAALTRQLLAFSRRQIMKLEAVDLNTVVSHVEKMLRRLIGEDIELKTIAGKELGNVKVDAGQIEQVIMNLALNARDAMPQGGKLSIEATNVALGETYAQAHVTIPPGPYVMLAVTDTGCGMSREVQEHIFEPFFTTKEKGKGTGLGLAMVHGIVKQSGGYIWAHSEVGHGSTFNIYFPRVDTVATMVEPVRVGPTLIRGSETILVVEDENSLRSLVRTVLGANGYTVLEATRGEEALRICDDQNNVIDLVLTDVVMPQMNGREMAKHLASRRPKTKVLFMSGYTHNGIVQDGISDDLMPFIQKPFTPDALARKVREVLAA